MGVLIKKKKLYYLILESIVIIFSILFTFSLESYRDRNRLIERKNILLSEIKSDIENDIIQIKKIKRNQQECILSSQLLIEDFINEKSFDEKKIAQEFQDLTTKLPISFFPRKGIYNQILLSGSIDIIENDLLKNELISVYDDLESRNIALSRSIDEFALFTKDIANSIVVVTEPSEELNTVYKESNIIFFMLDEQYYSSEEVLYFYSESNRLSNNYLSVMIAFEKGMENILPLINEELLNN